MQDCYFSMTYADIANAIGHLKITNVYFAHMEITLSAFFMKKSRFRETKEKSKHSRSY